MLKQINGAHLQGLLQSGIANLEKHRARLNELNVFPVPDGDTGTNMVMTLRYGLQSLADKEPTALGALAKAFATAAVFGARGNSGVILSQFCKGFAEALQSYDEADTALLSAALQNGYRLAYAAVAKPVEGTMLTVLRDAASAAEAAAPHESVEALLAVYLTEARASLARTPSLLPVLKKAGVVDSGGSGVVVFFEGMEKYLRGEEITPDSEEAPVAAATPPDLSLVSRDTDFSLGYCTEGLIQLTRGANDFDAAAFKAGLERLGESIVASLEDDKIKLHIHTRRPGRVLDYCQQVGEFLTLKIENMTLQHLQKLQSAEKTQKFLVAEPEGNTAFAVVAVATTREMQQMFHDMGADVVILSDIAPSSGDFMEAFALTRAKEILVFPNSANSILSSMQAGGLYREGRVTVLNCRSIGECYASLSVLDFEGSADEAVAGVKDTIAGLYELGIYHATKDATYGSRKITKNAFFSLSDKTILHVGTALDEVTLQTVRTTMARAAYSVLTVFCGKDMAEEYVDALLEKIDGLDLGLEVAAVYTEETLYSFSLLFE